METNLVILTDLMKSCSSKMFDRILDDWQKNVTLPGKNNYIYTLFIETFKSIELCCIAVDIQAYSQVNTLLRQLLEQVAICKLLILHEKCLETYSVLAKLKIEYRNGNFEYDKDKIKKSEMLTKLMADKELDSTKVNDRITFLETGWLLDNGISSKYGIEEIIKAAELGDYLSWRKVYNQFMHTNITIINFVSNLEPIIIETKYTLAVLFDQLRYLYHNFTGFDFVFDDYDYNAAFGSVFTEITNIKNKRNKQ